MFRKFIISILLTMRRIGHGLVDPVIRHSHIVQGTKALLLFFAFTLIALILIFPLFNTNKNDLIPAVEDQNFRKMATPTMMNPRFQGTDNKERPFHIEADAAVKSKEDKVSLTNVLANLTLDQSRLVKANAVQAVYAVKDRYLDLFGNIHIQTSDGYELDTASAHIDLTTNTTTGKTMVTLQGDVGTLTAHRFKVEDNDRIYFSENVRMIVYPNAALENENNIFDPTAKTLPEDQPL